MSGCSLSGQLCELSEGKRKMPALNKIIGVNLMLLILSKACRSWVNVLQSPQSVDATEGDSVTMYCAYGEGMAEMPVSQVSWTRGASREKATDLESDLLLINRLEKSKPHHFIERKIFIKISDLRLHDSDTYYCVVKAMDGELRIGNGTKVHVKRQPCGSELLSPPVTGLLVGKCILIVFLILFGVVACLVKPKTRDCSEDPTAKSVTSEVCMRSLMSHEEQ
ncbi:natural cytotoxicity triggering receptor 3-like [Heterodontus francisci]|uniref:natural cytotoxicity triggering receptor 3-like n=1 Tax=Heterodontus francisci TaxID=7792 RepID=UPI00355C31C9